MSLQNNIQIDKGFFLIDSFCFYCINFLWSGKLKKKTVVQTLDFAYLEGCETGKGDCKPIEIIRQSKHDSVLLIFPNGGTESDVYLHSTKNKNLELHDKKVSGQGMPTLNLTDLDDGEYSVNIISCGLGGSCLVRIKTKQP